MMKGDEGEGGGAKARTSPKGSARARRRAKGPAPPEIRGAAMADSHSGIRPATPGSGKTVADASAHSRAGHLAASSRASNEIWKRRAIDKSAATTLFTSPAFVRKLSEW